MKRLLLAVFLAIALMAPRQAPAQSCSSPDGQTGGCANPASVYCIQEGGTLENHESEKGQYSMCTFPNGRKCDEWKLFRRECNPDRWFYADDVGFNIKVRSEWEGDFYRTDSPFQGGIEMGIDRNGEISLSFHDKPGRLIHFDKCGLVQNKKGDFFLFCQGEFQQNAQFIPEAGFASLNGYGSIKPSHAGSFTGSGDDKITLVADLVMAIPEGIGEGKVKASFTEVFPMPVPLPIPLTQ